MHQPKAIHSRFAVLLLLVTAIFAFAQHPADSQQPASATSTLKVITRLTQVDITATDASGHPVHGLTRSDFTVKEDNKPQPIKDFEESGTAPAPSEVLPQLPPNVYSNALPPSANPVNVLLLDNVTTGDGHLFITPRNIEYARDQSIKYVNAMPVGTQAVILDLRQELRLVQGLTSDRSLLLAALHSVTYTPVFQASKTTLDVNSVWCRAANAQSEIVLGALKQAAALLAGIKGRKNLIWFTPGIPWLTDYTGFVGKDSMRDRSVCMRDHTKELQSVYIQLAAARVAI